MNEHTVTSNTSLSGTCDDETPAKVADQGGQPSTSAFDPLQESYKTLTFHPSAIPDGSSLNYRIPPEILGEIFSNLTARRDLLYCTRVSKLWCECSIKLLWRTVSCPDSNTLSKMGRVLMASQQTFTYARFIRRLEMEPSTSDVEVFSQFIHCDNLEHLSLIGCHHAPEEDLIRVFVGFQNLSRVNLFHCSQVTDDLLIHLACTTKRLEEINLGACKRLTEKGISALAGGCPGLRCFKFKYMFSITDSAVTTFARSCPLLARITLSSCPLVTDLGVRSLWRHSTHMQEMFLDHCAALTSNAFPAPFPRSGQEGLYNIDPSFPSSPTLNTVTGDGLLPSEFELRF